MGEDAAGGRNPGADGPGVAPQPRPVRVRRAPRYRAFTLTGVAVGLVVATAFGVTTQGSDAASMRTVLTYLGLGLGLIGGLLGAAAAVLVERRRG